MSLVVSNVLELPGQPPEAATSPQCHLGKASSKDGGSLRHSLKEKDEIRSCSSTFLSLSRNKTEKGGGLF